MKKLLLFVLAVMGFAACTQDVEVSVIERHDTPETITVGFEGDDTRIQLNEAQKTVWTKNDLVSVFYKSNANQKWEYRGETGERVAELYRVDAGLASRDMDYVVLAYPYNADYIISTTTGNIEAKLPATQHYTPNSYGVGDNLMVSKSEFTQFSLKSVCGWLKLQLTGDGETIKSIKFRGNNGEQVAGLIYVDTVTAEAILAAEMGSADDNNAGGNLVFEDTILTEVTLDCGEGVALGKNATAFYIALPPQTFEQGFTVEIEDTEGYVMEQSTDKALLIGRNHIQPMATMEFTPPQVPNNQIWYTSSDGNIVEPNNTNFDANIISNTYNNGMGIITFDGDVTTIGDYAFYCRTRLTSVNIPDSVTTIGGSAFERCYSLTSVNIPDSVKTIGNDAFYSCDSLTSVTIGNSVTTIGNSAFVQCASLTSVTIGDSVTEIGDYAFGDCSSLTSVNIPDSVTTIGERAFISCSSLTSVNIPDSVKTIGNSAFQNCYSLTSITIPDSVTTIGNSAFMYCTSLQEFKGKFASEDGRSLIMDNTIIAYANASGTTYTIPDSVTTIGETAFANCNRLTSVNIPDSVKTIGNDAFEYCGSLTSVTIPNSVTTIGDYAFSECRSLTSVYCKATTPPLFGDYVFVNNGSGRKIYVPTESVEAYKSAWSGYASSIIGYNF